MRSTAVNTLIFLMVSLTSFYAEAARLPAEFVSKKFSVSVRGVDLSDLLRIIAAQGGVTIEIDSSVKGKVSYNFKNATLASALEKIVDEHGLLYTHTDGVIFVEKDAPPAADGVGRTSNGSRDSLQILRIKVDNSNAQSIFEKIPKNFFKLGESVVVDDSSNTFVFHGGEQSFRKLTEFVEIFDVPPIQILIEAQIIETSKNFFQDIGFKWMGIGNAVGETGSPSAPNLNAKLMFGTVAGAMIEADLKAAESSGVAKIISRPKVITLNNQAATINSGVTFNVKTLSTSSGTAAPIGGGPSVTTGGLQQVNAGLLLQVHPVAVGRDSVKLKINVTNSEPSDGFAVDGIPGIVDNSANTSILVKDGHTAVMAGLIKSSLSNAVNRIPWIHYIPVIGWLFSSHSRKDRNSELVILITPRIILSPAEMKSESSVSVRTQQKN